MMEFHVPELGDQHWVEEILEQEGNECCEYSFVNLFAWCQAYDLKITRWEERMVVYLTRAKGPGYLYPVGSGDIRPVLEAMRDHAARRAERFRLLCVNPRGVAGLETLYPGQFQVEADRDSFDYLYDIHRLADLEGKRLHAKRNHIHRFEDMNPGWSVEELTADNLSECLAMDEVWNRENSGYAGDDTLTEENVALHRALRNYTQLGLEGLLLRADGRVIGFTAGRRMCEETYDVHFEKAFGEIQGAYAIINREFARWVRAHHPEIRWLNREDDMGVEGLRKAKESYYPDRMMEKYTVTWKA